MSSSTTKDKQCLICLEDIVREDGEHPFRCCPEESCSATHRECIGRYVTNRIETAFLGSCPQMFCPTCDAIGKDHRRILPYGSWSSIVSSNSVQKFTQLSDSLLAFLCGGCHVLKSLNLPFSPEQLRTAEESLKKMLDGTGTTEFSFESLKSHVNDLQIGLLTVEKFYNLLQSKYLQSTLGLGTDQEAWTSFSSVLRLIKDPERRANLHLRHLRERPRIYTPCCHREHCFRCRTRDYHEGKSCEENSASLDHTLITCPSCSIFIAKGDGCNTVTCVCGKQFSWTAEKENMQRATDFLQRYPENTSYMCAVVLCDEPIGPPGAVALPLVPDLENDVHVPIPPPPPTPPPTPPVSIILLAKAWQSRNTLLVNNALLRLWTTRYPACPAQACVILGDNIVPEGLRQASTLFRTKHTKDVDKCKMESDLSVRSIFGTMFPLEKERAAAAIRILGVTGVGLRLHPTPSPSTSSTSHQQSSPFQLFTKDPMLIASARLWRDEHKVLYDRESDDWEKRMARQFLYLHGLKSQKTTNPVSVQYAFPVEWSTEASNTHLTFSRGNTSVERIGSVSCYPAAFADLPSDRCCFTVILEACPRGTNWLSFGVCRRGRLQASSSDGVGRTSGTWGICDDRGTSDMGHARVYADSTEVAQCRKFLPNDRLCAVLNTTEGWCEVSVNSDEFLIRFDVPIGSAEDYQFAMTFANDHRAVVVQEGYHRDGDAHGLPGELNMEHSEMLRCLKRRMRKVLLGRDSDAGRSVHMPSVRHMSSLWVHIAGGTLESARGAISTVGSAIELAIGRKLGLCDGFHAWSVSVASQVAESPLVGEEVATVDSSLDSEKCVGESEPFVPMGVEEVLRNARKRTLSNCSTATSTTACISSVSSTPPRNSNFMVEAASTTSPAQPMLPSSSNTPSPCRSRWLSTIEKACADSGCYDIDDECDSDTGSTCSSVIVQSRSPASEHEGNIATIANYNWQEIMCAVCFLRIEGDAVAMTENFNLGEAFLRHHGESAPFIAAAYCTDTAGSGLGPGTTGGPPSEERRTALAYMRTFSSDMQAWYDYNSSLSEPLFGLPQDRNCRCLPRHTRRCPYSTQSNPISTPGMTTSTTRSAHP